MAWLPLLHSFNGNPDGAHPNAGLVQGNGGNLYGAASQLGSLGFGTLYRISLSGGYSVLYNFNNTTGAYPNVTLMEHTNGAFYGDTTQGGTGNVSPCSADACGVFYTFKASLSPFATLLPYAGTVGSKIGILGQGFSASSVVKFNGVTATTVTRTGTTFLLATVPAGASDGKVTVTTGATTLTSLQRFIVHNSWSSGAAIPKPVAFATATVLNNKIYVVGGYPGMTYSGPVGNNQIYNPATNAWSAGASLPTGTAQAAAAAVKNILYVFGGTPDGATDSNAVWAYNPATNTWSPKAAMPTARRSIAATVENNIIYVVGGFSVSGGRLDTVEAYDPATNSWTEEAPLLVGKSEPAVGLVGTTIVSADGYNGSTDNGDNEGYNAATNKWTALKADPKPRNAACGGAIGSQIYIAGGGNTNGPALTSTESFALSTNSWTALASVPQGTVAPGSAVYGGQLYCIGGWASSPDGVLLKNVQVYQP